MTNIEELRTDETAAPEKPNRRTDASPASVTSGTPTQRQSTLSRGTREEHDALLVAIHRLEAALAAAAPGREHEWGARVRDDLRLVQEALERHITSAESLDGLFAEIDLNPHMTGRVEQLRKDHAKLLRQVSDLQEEVEQFWCVEWTTPDFGAVRKHAADLLRALRKHQAQEADLIFETFYTDIGAGD